ncbi:FAD dependent oxidoreductase [Truncatella angustata]|uniref:FAD dependent oxidoreductase n=1 Tax=Truncatella angustata TaxID=152316 RepID=A0A9P8UDR8_9PEZI|nr:FAD dependent oxidoreductase [Truncatella angustata]KAH6648055.1 FAD dependent oxidoreductase [Truncatella angustata]
MGSQCNFPVTNATVPFWRTDLDDIDNHSSTDELPAEQDIIVIGAGFAGAACAYYLVKDKPNPPSITILEAREACSGATGRNGGHCRPDLHAGFANRRDTKGFAAANAVACFEVANLNAVRGLVKKERIECNFEEVTSANVYLDEKMAIDVKQNLVEMKQQGCPTAKLVKYHGIEDAERISGVRGAKAVTTFPAATLWPYKFIMHLLKCALDKDVYLETNTPVFKVSESADRYGYWTVSTQRGDIRAKQVVFATNGYTSGLLPEYKQVIHPVRGICSRITASGEPPTQGKLKSMVQYYGPKLADYQGNLSDGSFVIGGAWSNMKFKHPEQWLDVVDDSRLPRAAATYFHGFMERTFIGWDKAQSKVDSTWTGIMGYTEDNEPHIGKVPSKEGLYICAGFNGHGMPLILLSAKGIAKMLEEDCDFSKTGIPAIYETSKWRLQKPQVVV